MTTIYKLIERVNVNFNDIQDSNDFSGNECFFSRDSILQFIADNDLHYVNINGLGSKFALEEEDLGHIQGWLVSPMEHNHEINPDSYGFGPLFGINIEPEVHYYAIVAIELY